jgi:N-acetyl-gamma-glutamyl-phosphate reductase
MTTVAIAGASGYAGAVLIGLIHEHPEFNLLHIAAGSNAGASLSSVHPQFSAVPELANRLFVDTDPELLGQADLVFLALPHGQSAQIAQTLPSHTKVVDLGADFRLTDADQWAKYYGGPHAGSWTYGLPEMTGARAKIAAATRIANPGCYATAIAVGLAPFVQANAIDVADVVVVAASGTSGAGRSAKVNLLGSEVMGSLSPYKIGGTHQHTPEIEQTLSALTDEQVAISFTPILAPMPRGILATLTARTELTDTQLRELANNLYADEPFVAVLPEGQMPQTSSTLGSNSVHLQIAKDEHAGRLVVVVAIDNLVKGAAGQALQNANLICGYPETLGLCAIGVAP